MLDFNLLSAVRACRAALPHLTKREGSAIVNVSWGMALQPSALNVDYSTAKAAVKAASPRSATVMNAAHLTLARSAQGSTRHERTTN